MTHTHKASEIKLRECYFDSDGRCGYCWNNRGLFSSGFNFKKVSTENYNDLLNYGYCRYGLQFYLPDAVKSCCKVFGHRLDVTKFVPRPSQKKAIKRWERFLANPVPEMKKENLIPKDQDSIGFEELKVSNEDEDVVQEERLANEKLEGLDLHGEEQKQLEEKILLLDRLEKLREVLTEKDGRVSKELGLPEDEGLIIEEKAQKSMKLLKPNSKKHGDYNSNLLLILYLENQGVLMSLDISDIGLFVKKIETIVLEELSNIDNGSFKIQVQQNGYISFYKAHEKLEKKKEQSINRKILKAKEVEDKEDVKPQLNNKSQNKKSGDDLLDSELEENCQKLKIKLVRAEFDPEAHALYYKHCTLRFPKKTESSKSTNVFRTFFCVPAIEEQILTSEIPSPNNEPAKTLSIGNFHMKYYLEGKLIALGVLDIIPTGMQSIYFLFDPAYSYLSLGVIGVIKEIDYMKKLQKYFPDFKYYYLGGYIQTCPKIKYKVDYDPAELLCPITKTWVKFDEKIKQKIDNGEIRLAEDDVKVPEDLDFSEIDLDQYIMWSVKVNSMKFFEVNGNITTKIMQPLRKSVVLLGKKMINDINFEYFDFEGLYDDFRDF